MNHKVGRNSYVQIEPSNIVTPLHYKEQASLHSRLRTRNKAIEQKLIKDKAAWDFTPPEPMVIRLKQDCGEMPAGVVVSVCQRLGAVLLSRRAAHIFADDVNPDVELEGSYEQLVHAFGL